MRDTPLFKQVLIRPGETVIVDLEGSSIFRLSNIKTNNFIKGHAEDSSGKGKPINDMMIDMSWEGRYKDLRLGSINEESIYRKINFNAPSAKEDVSFTIALL